MNEEEKKAIEDIKKLIYGDYDSIILKDIDGYTLWNEDFETILNLIDKQEKEIEKLKQSNEGFKRYTVNCRELEIEINNEWKDKIREKIKFFKSVKQEIFRLENKLGIPSITYDIVRNDYCEKMLEDLLKE